MYQYGIAENYVNQRAVQAHVYDAHVGREGLAEGVEEPAVRVYELLLVLLLEAEDHLARHDALLGALELEVRVERDLRGVLLLDVGTRPGTNEWSTLSTKICGYRPPL